MVLEGKLERFWASIQLTCTKITDLTFFFMFFHNKPTKYFTQSSNLRKMRNKCQLLSSTKHPQVKLDLCLSYLWCMWEQSHSRCRWTGTSSVRLLWACKVYSTGTELQWRWLHSHTAGSGLHEQASEGLHSQILLVQKQGGFIRMTCCMTGFLKLCAVRNSFNWKINNPHPLSKD